MIAKFQKGSNGRVVKIFSSTMSLVMLMLVTSSEPGASQCPGFQQYKAKAAQVWAFVAQLKKTGDCSFLDQVVAADKQAVAICRDSARRWPGLCTCSFKDVEEFDRKLFRKYCKEKNPVQANTASSPLSTQSPPTAALQQPGAKSRASSKAAVALLAALTMSDRGCFWLIRAFR
jgi:hypothetical protein